MISLFEENGYLPAGNQEVRVTREKLRSLEARYEAVKQDPGTDAHIQELTLRSLKRMINQMTEEIVRFDARESVQTSRH